jgi:hypothetical protein
VFLDIKAAYDSVDRRILWNKLVSKGAPAFMVRILKSLFDECHSTVAVNGKDSGKLVHQAGLLQGSIISPVLYSLFVNDMAQRLREVSSISFDGCDYKGGFYKVPGAFFYADDIAVVGKDPDETRDILRVCEEHSKENNYEFNPKKCKFTAAFDVRLSLYGEPLGRVNSFVYLGVDFDHTGARWDDHFARRIEKAKAVVARLKGFGFHGHGLGERSNLMAYKALIRPTLEFGLSAMPPREKVFRLLDKTQGSFLRQMLSLPRCANGVSLNVMCALPTFSFRHRELRARRLLAIEQRGPGHMVHHAAMIAMKKEFDSARSSFRGWDTNGIVLRFRMERLQAQFRKATRREYPDLSALIIEERVQHLEYLRTKMPRRGAWKVSPDAKPKIFYSLGRVSKRDRRLIICFVTQCLFWGRLKCKRCGSSLTYSHLLDCANVRSAQDWCRIGAMSKAASRIREGVLLCRPDSG